MNKKSVGLFIASSALFLLLLFTTSPYRLPLLFVIVPLIPAVTCVVLLVKFALELLKVPKSVSQKLTGIAGLVTGVTAVLLSLGQFTFRDFTFLFLFGLVATFYISRMFR